MELSSILLQFEQTQEQILNLLNGRPYSPEVLDPQDPMARKTVAAALIEGMTSEGSESQRRAREAFIRHGYLSEASERLLTALSPAERSESATQIGIAGDPTMLDSLFSVLEDGSREVRRAAIEAIRKIGDPVAIPALRTRLYQEADENLAHSIIPDAIRSLGGELDESAPLTLPDSEPLTSDATKEDEPLAGPVPSNGHISTEPVSDFTVRTSDNEMDSFDPEPGLINLDSVPLLSDTEELPRTDETSEVRPESGRQTWEEIQDLHNEVRRLNELEERLLSEALDRAKQDQLRLAELVGLKQQAEAEAGARRSRIEQLESELAIVRASEVKEAENLAVAQAGLIENRERLRSLEDELRRTIEGAKDAEVAADMRLRTLHSEREKLEAETLEIKNREDLEVAKLESARHELSQQVSQYRTYLDQLEAEIRGLNETEQQLLIQLQDAEATRREQESLLRETENSLREVNAEFERLNAEAERRLNDLEEERMRLDRLSRAAAEAEEAAICQLATLKAELEASAKEREDQHRLLDSQIASLRTREPEQSAKLDEAVAALSQLNEELRQADEMLQQHLIEAARLDDEVAARRDAAIRALDKAKSESSQRIEEDERLLAELSQIRDQARAESHERAEQQRALNLELSNFRRTEQEQKENLQRAQAQRQEAENSLEHARRAVEVILGEASRLESEARAEHQSAVVAKERLLAETLGYVELQKQQIREIENAIREAQAEASELEEKKSRLQLDLRSLDSEIAEQVRVVSDSESLRAERLEAIRAHEEAIAAIRNESHAYELRLRELRNELKLAEAQGNGLRNNVGAAEADLARLHSESLTGVSGSDNAHSRIITEVDALSRERESRISELDQAEEQRRKLLDDLKMLDGALSSIAGNSARLEEELNKRRQQQAEIEKTASQIREIEDLNRDLAEERSRLLSRKTDVENENRRMAAEISELRSEQQPEPLHPSFVMSSAPPAILESVQTQSTEEEIESVEARSETIADSFDAEGTLHLEDWNRELVAEQPQTPLEYESNASHSFVPPSPANDLTDSGAATDFDIQDLADNVKAVVPAEADPGIVKSIDRIGSESARPFVGPRERAEELIRLGQNGEEDAYSLILEAFDDPVQEVRNEAARALCRLGQDRAATFTRALRESDPERRRRIASALVGSGLAAEAISNLTGENRERTYDAFSLLFLMAKVGEVQPLINAVGNPTTGTEAQLTIVKMLSLSGRPEAVAAFRRLAVRGSLAPEVRSSIMEGLHQIGTMAPDRSSARM